MTPDLSVNRIRPDVQAMHAYVVQDASGLIKLDAMENPYALSAELQAVLGQRLGAVAINRYPGARTEALKTALANSLNVQAGEALMLGNGSDELISLLALACAQPHATVLAPLPGFVMYGMSAQLQGLRFVGVDLMPNFALDVPAMLAAIAQHKPAITYLAYPNNPTANAWAKDDVAAVIAACAAVGGLVVMDEAYQPFASHTWLDVMRSQPEQHRHVLLMRTLSKFGLAGIRLGYMLGAANLIGHIDKVRPPYNVSVLNTECALFALEHQAFFANQAQAIRAERERLLAALHAMPQLNTFDSQANMILVRLNATARGTAAVCFTRMKTGGVLIKNVSTMHPLLHNCLRLTVGTPAENDQMLQALQAALTEK